MTEPLDSLFTSYRQSDAPGCIVGVARHGKPVYRAAFGMANVEHGVANSVTTRMPIASVTKHFTCAALLTLAAEGKVSLESPVGDWLPELAPEQRRPTLRQLMTHTGGIRCYLDHAVFNGYETMPAGAPQAIQWRQTQLNFEPGQGAAYSNGGYLLLSSVIERAADASLESVLKDRLFRPLEMHATSLPRRQRPVQFGVATTYLPYHGVTHGWRHGMLLSEEMLGDGGMVSTVDDLLRWAGYLRGSTGSVSRRTLTAATPLPNGGESSYGFGLITETWRGVKLAHHAGGLPGASSTFLMVPEEGLDVVVLCNRPAPVVELSLQVVEALIGDRIGRQVPPPVAKQFEPLLGQYIAQDTGLMMGFADLNGELGLSLFGGVPFALQAQDMRDDMLPFSADVGTGNMRFRGALSDAQTTDEIQYLDGGVWHIARRIMGERMTPAEVVAAASGSYYSTAAAATLRFGLSEGALNVHTRGEYGQARYCAESIGPDLVRFWPSAFPGGALIRFERQAGAVECLLVSTSRTRRTVFTRAAAAPAP